MTITVRSLENLQVEVTAGEHTFIADEPAGVGDNAGFLNHETDATSYNGKTATYRYVHELTGKPIWVDTSFGLSQQADSWTAVPPDELNRRAREGVFAVNVTMPPGDYAARLSTLRAALDPVCP